ncbi:MAG: tetratricopeptide repeat protein [Bacteroidetes bacterium]|nr:tetratricopeptide repeat protein [Bacteroidota bacterium]
MFFCCFNNVKALVLNIRFTFKYLFFLFITCSYTVFAQNDSATIILNSNLSDSVKIHRIEAFASENTDNLGEKIAWCKSLQNYAIEKDRRDLLARAYCIMGTTYYDFSQYDKAITFLYKSLPIAEEMKMELLQSRIYNYLGIINSDQGNSKKAIYFFRKTYAIAVKLNDLSQQFTSANNLGVDYNSINVPVLGLYYITICEKIAKKHKVNNYLPSIFGNKMESYMRLNDPKKAKETLDSVYTYFKKTSQDRQEQISLNYFSGEYYSFINDYKKAIPFLEKNIELILPSEIQEYRKNYKILTECYTAIGDYENSYKSIIKYYQYSDSLVNSEKMQKSSEIENSYKNFKVEKELEIQKLNNINKSLQLKRNKAFLILVSSLSLLLIGGIFFFYKLFRDKRRANVLLEEQKLEISHQKKEILDSIYYSKRIQEGILPNENELNQKIGEHFVFFKPKDIVSGDFYWAGKNIGNNFLMACCDCTGHGVPGAFMSLVAYSLLNKIDESAEHKNPSEILDYLNIELPKFFKKEDSSQQIKDGMDMSLIEVDRKNLKLKFSGANNSIYHIRDGVLNVIKADKQPISADVDMRKYIFKTTELELKKNDLIVMFTDGYADQFGGPTAKVDGNLFRQGKKFMYKRLEELLMKHASQSMSTLKNELETAHNDWRGDLEQIDDVCLIGIRI